ncbi:MAG: hypothetical protein LWW85_03320 [Marinilabiliales bacterium]|nr:hypothetical protein [Marinilabiliales bacterium]
MKTRNLFFILFLLLTSCHLFDDKSSTDSGSISGSSAIAINTVGNTFVNTVRVGSSSYNGTISITSVTDGVATISFKCALPSNVSALSQIKSKYKDAQGNLNCVGKFKMTDGGILDYNNVDHQPFALVKYDANVGDKYTLKKSDGTTITREVIRKSTTDDFYWNGMNIKTVDVEQSSKIPGVTKIWYFTNHKFGLVAVRLFMEDGSTPQLTLYPNMY